MSDILTEIVKYQNHKEREKEQDGYGSIVFKIFEVSNKINSKAPYYIQILLFSLMIFLSYLILFKTFPPRLWI